MPIGVSDSIVYIYLYVYISVERLEIMNPVVNLPFFY